MCISSMTRRISGSGQSEPAMTPVLSDVRSNVPEVRVLELGQEHRRHAVQRRASLAMDGLEHAPRIEGFDRTQAGAVRVRAKHADHAAETVEQRHAQAQPVGGGQADSGAERLAVVDDVAAGEHHAFREPGGSRRVLHVDHVVDADRGAARVELGIEARPPRGSEAPRSCVNPRGASRPMKISRRSDVDAAAIGADFAERRRRSRRRGTRRS